jgi:hypothetical protein
MTEDRGFREAVSGAAEYRVLRIASFTPEPVQIFV